MDSTPPSMQNPQLMQQGPMSGGAPKLMSSPHRPQFLPRGVNQQQWRGQVPGSQPQLPSMPAQSPSQPPTGQQTVPLFQANLQPAPPVPPENIQSEQDQQMQIQYEQWIETQAQSLQSQLSYYETEVMKLRKSRKTLNSKQRQMKKAGGDLTEEELRELAKVAHEQSIIQKQLENARKQSKQHATLKQDYETKKMNRLQAQQGGQPTQSPAQMAPQSPLMQPGQSPHPQMIHQPSQSPMQSPSPLMASQSPGPSILQSPGHHTNSNSAMSPYNTMSQSPRIGTPHSQPTDDNPFSPTMNAGPSPSPSLPGRLTSPAPRMTSPQHRMAAPSMTGGRLITSSPGQQFAQQNIIVQNQFTGQIPQQQQQQQVGARFVRPQMMQNENIRLRMPGNFQQQGQPQQIIRQQGPPQGYNQQPGQNNMENIQNQRTMLLVQQRQIMQQRQMQNQMNQQQMVQGQGQMSQQMVQQLQNQQMQAGQMSQQQMAQMNAQYARQSPIHQPPSPLLSQNTPSSPMMPRSPMVNYGQQQQQQQQQLQNPTSPMMVGNSPLMRRPPSTGVPDRPQSVESSPRQGWEQGGGGGNPNMNPIPYLPPDGYQYSKPGLRGGNSKLPPPGYRYKKLGLRGGAPMWGLNQGNKKPPPSSSQSDKVRVSVLKKKVNTTSQPQLVSSEYNEIDDSSCTPPTLSPGPSSEQITTDTIKIRKKSDGEVVIIDSSPDEKQRLMDYDDDNDRSVVLTEASLSSVAHLVETDDIHIEQFQGFDNMVAGSPLEGAESNDDYALFNSDVAEYVETDDQTLIVTATKSDSGVIIEDESQESEVRIVESPNVEVSEVVVVQNNNKKHEGTDFEAMIDGGGGASNSSAAGPSSSSTVTIKKEEDKPSVTITKREVAGEGTPVITISSSQLSQHKNVTYQRIPLTQTILNPRTIVASGVANTKKLKDTAQTTAKYSIGNTTIQVPVLKNVSLGQQQQQQQKSTIQMKKITTSSPINILRSPTIITVGGRKIQGTSE